MAEQPLPFVAAVAEVLRLGTLIATRDAARMSFGGVHLGAPAVELSLLGPVTGALPRPALFPFAVRRHRSSKGSKLTFTPAYHVTTE